MEVTRHHSGESPQGAATHPETSQAMRTILVDDHPPFLAALAALLRGRSSIEVVGRAYNGTDGIRLAVELTPDLVLVDFNMPDMDGLAVARCLKAGSKPPKVVIVTSHSEPEYKDMALKSGVDGYVVKSEINQELLPLLRQIAP